MSGLSGEHGTYGRVPSDERAENQDLRTPRQRWGTCCPYDPECDHSYLDEGDLAAWMDSPITDAQARTVTA